MADAAGRSAVVETFARPALVVALSIAVLSSMDALIKSFGPQVAILQLVWLRYAAGAAFGLVIYLATGPHRITRRSLTANGLRALVMLVAAGSFFYAITRMPLVEAVTLSFTAPIFMVLIARLVLGEPITRRALLAVAIGFAGVIVVVWGGGSTDGGLTPDGTAAALLSALAYAFGIILLRKHSAHDAIPVLVFLQAALSVVVMTPVGIATWTPVPLDDWMKYVVIGFLGTVGHLLMAWGFSRAPAGELAPIEYTNLLWASLFGLVFFHETPALTTYAGAALIVIACFTASRRNRLQRRLTDASP